MKKIVSIGLVVVMACVCIVCFGGCAQELKPHEIIHLGHKISLWMTREEIEGMLGEGTEGKSKIHYLNSDVVAYGESLEIRYARDEWEDNPAKQIADRFFFNDSTVQTHKGIKVGDGIETIPAKYEFSSKVGGGYETHFLQGHNVEDSTYAIHDVEIFYHKEENSKIVYIEVSNMIYTQLWQRGAVNLGCP